jgi:large subunit ribosomal protein L13
VVRTSLITRPHVDCGDFVIVTNCDKIKFTGNKLDDKLYINYSGYPGGKKEETARELLRRPSGCDH